MYHYNKIHTQKSVDGSIGEVTTNGCRNERLKFCIKIYFSKSIKKLFTYRQTALIMYTNRKSRIKCHTIQQTKNKSNQKSKIIET